MKPEHLFPGSFFGLQRLVLRYGENPHQRAAFYGEGVEEGRTVAGARQLHGPALSFNNMLDIAAAYGFVRDEDDPACAIVKHTNPCGCARAETLVAAYEKARDGELPPFNPPGSRYGGVVACNRLIDARTASAIVAPQSYYEAILAPAFSTEAIAIITQRKPWGDRVRLLERTTSEADRLEQGITNFDIRCVPGGLLVQERDIAPLDPNTFSYPTARAASPEELDDLLFAWRIVRYVASNAIVIVKHGQMLGIGSGQINRVAACESAVRMAGKRAVGAVCASDGFFPFTDGLIHLATAGVTAVIQPGGSKADARVTEVCNDRQVAMVMTNRRCFRH